MIKKFDVFFIVAVLLAAAACLLLFSPKAGTSVEILLDGDTVGSYSLSQDRVIPVGEGNVVEISEGRVFMRSANCPDGYCVNCGAISAGCIVCLPNRVVVRVVDSAQSAPDAVTGGY